MALSSEARTEWDGYIRHWRSDWGKEFPTIAENILAVADHLAACEALLGEIALLPDSRAGHIASHPEQTLAEYIDALLGPAATKEGG